MQQIPVALGMPGPTELIIILFIILLIFGAKKLPELMRSMGKGVKEFKDGIKEGDEENKKERPENEPKPPSP